MAADEQQKKIVIIEDDPEMVSLVTLILKRDRFEIHSSNNGPEGLTLIEQIQPDIVLLDLMMPIMDGWEVYQTMKARDTMKSIPVIILTAKAQSIDKVLGLHIAKVADYITKPFSPTELLNSVHKVLARSRVE